MWTTGRIFGVILMTFYPGIASFSQDLIIDEMGDSVNCKISRIKNGYIYYTRKVNSDLINEIVAENGTIYHYNFYGQGEVYNTRSKVQRGKRWQISLHAGPGYRLGRLQDGLSLSEHEYLSKLKSGFTFGMDLSYSVSNSFAVGVVTDAFRSKNKANLIQVTFPDGTTTLADLSDKISIDYLGILASFRPRIASKNSLAFNIYIGFQSYEDRLTFDKVPLRAFAGAAGIGVGCNYFIMLSESFGVSLSVRALGGILSEINVDTGFGTASVQLEKGQYESLQRFSASLGITINR